MKSATVFDNPLFHFNAYGLKNPMVIWALEVGLYDEFCPGCRGRGFTFARPCLAREKGHALYHGPEEACWPDPSTNWRGCGSVCRECSGTRVRQDRVMCEKDFGDEESLKVAMVVAPDAVRDAMRRDTWSSKNGGRGSLR